MTAPNVLALYEHAFLFSDFQDPEARPALHLEYDSRIIKAADLAIEGNRKIAEASEYGLGIEHLDHARELVAEAHPLPDVALSFANYAAQTLTYAALDQMTEGTRRQELPFGAETVRPHLAAGKVAIERSLRHQMPSSDAVDLGVAGSIAETYLPSGTNLSGAWLHAAHLASMRCVTAEKTVTGLAAAQTRLGKTETMFQHLDGRKQPPFKTMRTAASFAIGCLVEKPALFVGQSADKH